MNHPIKIRTIASGSTGNTGVLRFGESSILVDAGVPFRRISAGLEGFGGVEGLQAIVLTHEHHDHVRGLELLLKACPNLPVYASGGTLKALNLSDRETHVLRPGVPVTIGSESVDLTGFRVSHDATEVMGLRFESHGHVACFVTDLGTYSDQTVEAVQGVHTLILESNYDAEMLRSGPYPVFLKRRIGGTRGHLSNDQSRALLERVAHHNLQRVVLAHLSETNNTPERARRTAEAFLAGSNVSLHVAAPSSPSPIWTPAAGVARSAPLIQLSLF
jgi:phosphoribosyl 1,2-cyclic phosphodiesterase